MQLKEFFKKNYSKTSEKKMIRQNSFSKRQNEKTVTFVSISAFNMLILCLLCPTGTDRGTDIEDRVMASHSIYIYTYIQQ